MFLARRACGSFIGFRKRHIRISSLADDILGALRGRVDISVDATQPYERGRSF